MTCDGYTPPPPPPPPRPDIWNPACSCEDFCNYKCANNGTEATTVTLYRLTPVGAGGLTNKDSGDAAGDVEFALSRKDTAAMCAQDPSDERCFLAHQNVRAPLANTQRRLSICCGLARHVHPL